MRERNQNEFYSVLPAERRDRMAEPWNDPGVLARQYAPAVYRLAYARTDAEDGKCRPPSSFLHFLSWHRLEGLADHFGRGGPGGQLGHPGGKGLHRVFGQQGVHRHVGGVFALTQHAAGGLHLQLHALK